MLRFPFLTCAGVVSKASTNSTKSTPKLLIVPGIRMLTSIEPANTSQPHPPSGGTRSQDSVSVVIGLSMSYLGDTAPKPPPLGGSSSSSSSSRPTINARQLLEFWLLLAEDLLADDRRSPLAATIWTEGGGKRDSIRTIVCVCSFKRL